MGESMGRREKKRMEHRDEHCNDHRVLYLQASFTIEACIIVPIIIFFLAAFIWLVFYLRNSVRIIADADTMVFLLEQDAARNKYEGKVNDSLTGAGSGYLGMEEARTEIERDGRDISVKLSITHKLPEEGILGDLVSGFRTINVDREERMPLPAEYSRIIKAAGELIGGIKQKFGKKQ